MIITSSIHFGFKISTIMRATALVFFFCTCGDGLPYNHNKIERSTGDLDVDLLDTASYMNATFHDLNTDETLQFNYGITNSANADHKVQNDDNDDLKINNNIFVDSDFSSLSSTCTNPLGFTKLPNSFSVAQYQDYRAQCTEKCNNDGYCCTKGFGGCNAIPCNEGCHIAFFAATLQECKDECDRGNNLDCYYDHSQHGQVGFLGYYPWWDSGVGVGKCWGADLCGCPLDNFGNDCNSNACSHGCDLAFESDIRDFFFNGDDAIIDPHIGLSASDLKSAISSLQSHVDGSSTLTYSQLKSKQDTFEANSKLLDMDFDAMNDALTLVESYETKYNGGIFINSRTNRDGFTKEDTNDGYTLERIVLAIQQAILDEVYQGTLPETAPQVRYHDPIVENCQHFLRGRYWKTSAYFPGYTELPSEQPTAVHTVSFDATVNKHWGRDLCYHENHAVHPTGLYLPPGGVAWIDFPLALVGQGFKVRVGANNSDLSNKDRHWRMDRVTSTFEVEEERTYLASPLGGGIYIEVPYLANYSTQSVDISGDVIKAPLFSMTNLKTTTKAEWDILKTSDAPWADFESEFFMQNVPTSWIKNYDYNHFLTLMEGRDAAAKELNYITGFPDSKRNKHVMYLQPDIQIKHDAYGTGYPQVNTLVHFGDDNMIRPSPGEFLVAEPYLGIPGEVEYHELSHCLFISGQGTMFKGEVEAIVNFPFAHIMNAAGGLDFDYAFSYSMGGATGILTPDMAAVDWMVTVNFREGNEMEKEYSENQEFQYQPRGYAKYADLYKLFGKEIFYNFYFEMNNYIENNDGEIEFGRPDGYDADDWHTLQWSIRAGVDLTPLLHFWGVHPHNSAKLQASMKANNLQVSTEIRDLITQRLTLIPKNRDEFLQFFREGWPGKENPEPWECLIVTNDCGLYIYWMDKWDETIANQAIAAGQAIVDLYYSSSPCSDSPLRFRLTLNGKNRFRRCSWVAKKNTANRCRISGVSETCPDTCGSCSSCVDSPHRFKLTLKGKLISRGCNWVAKKNTPTRCAASGVSEICRSTCGIC